jgi:hypothetical protein
MTIEKLQKTGTTARSTQPDFTPSAAFNGIEEELLYYKNEYQRLKAIIALQKKKIKKLIA